MAYSFNIFGMQHNTKEQLTLIEFSKLYGNEIYTGKYSAKFLKSLLESLNAIKVEKGSIYETNKKFWISEINEQITKQNPYQIINEENEKSIELIKKTTKQCPKCSVYIEKNGGCRAMHCQYKGCNTHFCWNCMKITGFHTDDHSCLKVPKGQERNVGFVIDSTLINKKDITNKKFEPKPILQTINNVKNSNKSRLNLRNRKNH
jgi:hypothetical protein